MLCGLGAAALCGIGSGVSAAPRFSKAQARAPGAFSFVYQLRRSGLTGTGQLVWAPVASSYQLRLEGRAPLLGTLIEQLSVGRLGPAGLLPERFTERRRGRDEQATEFRADQGKVVVLGGEGGEHPLVPGAQDRVSWMVQLAALALADPKNVSPGRTLTMPVVNRHGDTESWRFQCQPPQSVPLAGGAVRAARLVRPAQREGGAAAEVWLDPTRQYLPVRARLIDGRGDPLELLLQNEG
ncbi:hypothetical protein AAW51_5082 [Caldimonas brevitalea]|uniref:DUF3108 domain-containing protein n=1 Tax=Caldimonas brevitalea TaxID=413882 RepID=A0A0G3BUW6_9BURK|nr:hypothetical protein AAW51_5082 [Caldimonas brevitalea]